MEKYFKKIEKQLNSLLPSSVDSSWIKKVNNGKIEIDDNSLFDQICEPARDLVFRGGKRWRPLLMLLVAKMIGGQKAVEVALELVTLVELPHNGSLIIDDIEDNSVLRRGEKAVHIKYGVDISINAGNFLYYLPTLTIDNSTLTDKQKLTVYSIYTTYMRKIHLGQGMDIVWHRDTKTIPSIEAYKSMSRLKTGCLAAMGTQLGAAVATDDEKIIAKAAEIGEKIGLAFQIIDDIINLERGNVGKNRGDDIVENKKSLPIILWANKNQTELPSLFNLFEKAKKRGYKKSKTEILSFIDKLIQFGSLEEAKLIANEIIQEVNSLIRELFTESEERTYLLSMLSEFASK